MGYMNAVVEKRSPRACVRRVLVGLHRGLRHSKRRSSASRQPGHHSINLEDARSAPASAAHGSPLWSRRSIRLTIDEQGMALTCRSKVASRNRIHDLAVHKYGLRPEI